MSNLITGIHHVTALASDAQRNVDFYNLANCVAWIIICILLLLGVASMHAQVDNQLVEATIYRYKMCSIQNVNTLGGSSNKLPTKITLASREKTKYPEHHFQVFLP